MPQAGAQRGGRVRAYTHTYIYMYVMLTRSVVCVYGRSDLDSPGRLTFLTPKQSAPHPLASASTRRSRCWTCSPSSWRPGPWRAKLSRWWAT